MKNYNSYCPRGYTDCIYDPGYIFYYYPDWYKELYGDLTPDKAIFVKDGCQDKVIRDPYQQEYCYDDEDK